MEEYSLSGNIATHCNIKYVKVIVI